MLRRIIAPAMLTSYMLYRPKQCKAIVTHSSNKDKPPFPKYFIDEISDLNEKDKHLAFEEMKESLINYYPNKYKYIVDNITNHDIISELDYIRVMYKKPLGPERKITLRNNIYKIIKNNKCSQEELALFEYILKYYECIE